MDKMDNVLKAKYNFHRRSCWHSIFGKGSNTMVCMGVEKTPEGEIPKILISTNITENSFCIASYTQDINSDQYIVI